MSNDLLLPISGLLVGMLIGLTGIGGGVLMTPLLLMLGLPPTGAVGTDLAYSALTKLAGTWQHGRQGTIEWRVVRALAIGSVPATVVAVGILSRLHTANTSAEVEHRLKQLIGVMLVIAAVMMIRRVLVSTKTVTASAEFDLTSMPTGKVVAIGVFGGFLVGLTSIGSGSLIIALLVMVVALAPAKMVGTDIAHAFVLVTAGALAHQFFMQDVQIGIAGRLLIGSIPGIALGSTLAPRLPERALRILLAIILVLVSLKLILS